MCGAGTIPDRSPWAARPNLFSISMHSVFRREGCHPLLAFASA